MSDYTLSARASIVPILHAAKHPTRTVCGLLVGSAQSNLISDAIPLLHHSTELSAMMQVALELVESHVKRRGDDIMGLYVANERLGDLAVPLGLGQAAESIRRENPSALVLVLNLADESTAKTTWTPSKMRQVQLETPSSALTDSIRHHLESDRQNLVGDFDDHLEDASIDWLTNSKLSSHLS
ncbi:hypothetical protein JCM3766R1_004768 [Sporobolomyces carnicolor]